MKIFQLACFCDNDPCNNPAVGGSSKVQYSIIIVYNYIHEYIHYGLICFAYLSSRTVEIHLVSHDTTHYIMYALKISES